MTVKSFFRLGPMLLIWACSNTGNQSQGTDGAKALLDSTTAADPDQPMTESKPIS